MHSQAQKHEAGHMAFGMSNVDSLLTQSATAVATALALAFAVTALPDAAIGQESPLHSHCGDCHTGSDAEGDFRLGQIVNNTASGDYLALSRSLERITAGEMPPPTSSVLTHSEKVAIVNFDHFCH